MRILPIAMIIAAFLAVSVNAQTDMPKTRGGSLSTSNIINSAVTCIDCLDWKILGICYWLNCNITGCSVKTSLRVGHYIPEFVVSSYTSQSEWDETRSWNDNPNAAVAAASREMNEDEALDFKSVDVISHPATLIFDALGRSDLFCESANDVPMLPHFLSSIDPNWHDPTIEQLYPASVAGTPKITTGNWLPILGDGYWAPLFPRCGWGAHPYDPINAAVAAHRAAEIVTRAGQPHVYLPASGSCGNRCWRPGPVSIGGNDNRFQMIAPVSSNSHSTFGGSATWANGKQNINESYAWNLWRYYACCKPKGLFIDKTDFNP